MTLRHELLAMQGCIHVVAVEAKILQKLPSKRYYFPNNEKKTVLPLSLYLNLTSHADKGISVGGATYRDVLGTLWVIHLSPLGHPSIP